MAIRPHPTKGEGWWIIDFYPDGRKGKRIRHRHEGTKASALQLELELRRQSKKIDDLIAPLVKDIVPEWLKSYKNTVSEGTYRDASDALVHWLPYFGNFRPANISRKAINEYKSKRLKDVSNPKSVENGKEPKYYSKRTITRELSYFSSCIKWAAENGHCNDLSFQIKGFPVKQTRSAPPVVLTPRQITKMYQVIEPEYKLLFLLMADMGLRRNEAIYIKAENVDEFNETLIITGKGNKPRTIPWLSDRFAEELERALDKHSEGYLILNPKTEAPYNQIRKCIARAGKNAKISRHINPHLLRHSCLTNLARNGMSPHALQQIAGHSSIETTNKIYVHIRSDFVGEEARKIRQKTRV